jgi:hypothetical protein
MRWKVAEDPTELHTLEKVREVAGVGTQNKKVREGEAQRLFGRTEGSLVAKLHPEVGPLRVQLRVLDEVAP